MHIKHKKELTKFRQFSNLIYLSNITSTIIGNFNLPYQPLQQRKPASSNQDQDQPKHFKINDYQQQQNPKIDENQEQKQYFQIHKNQQQLNKKTRSKTNINTSINTMYKSN
ncbi:unnamed protein product [Rotaria socialis]|uniref:Uncharacterized protein n=1 Tax=Rotaria socialis TaxID=392032 RepID=A0A818ADX4_9BILA|nr:unnamed protein product [Rotaria socialis]CAF3493068.1 unnamed protein product [Rotaria socialis]CAF3601500.1 unnamed protein product [Rotaria socialis]CAF3611047.1 unnamed protein product [Rotaria socialis]CAF4113520.1 unnamed protein product [Rotaria socialis]